jgi:hypothetical protein
MRTDSPEKALEKLATSDKATIVVERQSDGKMRVTSGSWDGEKVFLRDQVLEVRNVDGRLHVARKPRGVAIELRIDSGGSSEFISN